MAGQSDIVRSARKSILHKNPSLSGASQAIGRTLAELIDVSLSKEEPFADVLKRMDEVERK